jgi:hypothetical protein
VGSSVIGSKSAVATGAKVLLAACVAAAAANVAATPAWARVRHPVGTTTTTTTALLTSTTTTLGTMPTPTPPVPAPADTCGKGVWPLEVQGRPQYFEAGDGVYLWNDPDGGWALRATHSGPQDDAVISGTLTTAGKFVDVRRGEAGDDIVAVSGNKRTILFRFVNYGWLDGFDFATRCSGGFSASFYIAGNLASTTSIHLGAAATSPSTNPFRVQRGRSAVVSSSLQTVPSTTATTTF